MVEQLKHPRPRRPYRTGDEALDAKVAELVAASGITEDAEILGEMLTSCFRIIRNHYDRGELKMVNAALKEFAHAFKVFREYRGYRKVSIFGSARAMPEDPNYEYTRLLAEALVQRGWMVITGAGPGIMAAGHQGAGAEHSFGAGIRLPMEKEPNVYIEHDPKLINFKYFFTRKVTFLKEASAFVLVPGGFGTMDETFELLTLMQTGKTRLEPIVLFEAPGGTYWEGWLAFIHQHLVDRGLISADDLALVRRADRVQDAVDEITAFYANYQSLRYVDGTLVLRVLRLPPAEDLERLSAAYAGILRTPGLRPVGPTPQETEDNDALNCARIALDFNQVNYGRLRLLIDDLNRW